MNRDFKVREDELTMMIYGALLGTISQGSLFDNESESDILAKYYTDRDLPAPENIDIWETAKMIVEYDYEEV